MWLISGLLLNALGLPNLVFFLRLLPNHPTNSNSLVVNRLLVPIVTDCHEYGDLSFFLLALPQAEDIAREVLEENLKDIKYDTGTCRQLAQTLSTVMRNRVKELNFERYKIVCLVHIGEMGRQAMRIAGRCLWDHEVDTFASVVYETKSIYSVAIIYAVYQE